MKRGEGDAVLMFCCVISEVRNAYWSRTYRESPNAELLKNEVLGRINQAQFEPAVYRGVRVPVYLAGAVNFFVREGKPHLRIFLNQEEGELLSGRDFVAPAIRDRAGE